MSCLARALGLALSALAFLSAGSASALAAVAEPGQESESREQKREHAEATPDRIGPELARRIRGQAPLGDVRIDVQWPTAQGYASVRIYGNGVVICDRKLQLLVKKDAVTAILKDLRKSGFGSMAPHYGSFGEEEERNEGPRLKGSVEVRAGSVDKSVLQLLEGEQSKPLEALALRILGVCRNAAQGTGAASLDEGLDKVVSGGLAPETLELILQRRADAAEGEAGETFVLELEGRRVTDRPMPHGRKPPQPKALILSEEDFARLVRLLAEARVGEIPVNVYEARYTDLRVTVLNHVRSILGRKFLNMTAETHGEKQTSFDRVYESLHALHERVAKEGKAVLLPVPPPDEGESEREREREKEKKD